MPLVKLTIRAEPVEVDEDELVSLRSQNLVEAVHDAAPAEVLPQGPADPPKTVPVKAGSENQE